MAEDPLVDNLIRRLDRLREDRGSWNQHWQDLADIFLPRRADFVTEHQPGAKRTTKVFDSTPMIARRGLTAALDGLLKPKTAKWFDIETDEKGVNENDQARGWLEDARNRLFSAIYNPKARFIQRTGEVDDDLVTFGTGVLFIGKRGGPTPGLLYRSLHLRDSYPVENADGDIDTLFMTITLTARQAAERYGKENLGDKTRELLEGTNPQPDKKLPFLWAVMPREQRDPRKIDNRNMAWASIIVDLTSESKVQESGFKRFPFAVPRWDTASGEVYGRSPAMLALADGNTLQQQTKTLLKAGHRAVDPPLGVISDSVMGAVKTFPGGITPFDAEAVARFGGRPPIFPIEMGGNVPLGREMQNDTRELIWMVFLRNVLNLPQLDRMTATEVLERKDEFVRTIGPVFGRLETDYIARIVEVSFEIMLEENGFAPVPPILGGRNVRFQYVSPVEQARKQIEAAKLARAFELLAPLAAVQPEITDNFDGDAIARDTRDIFTLPQRWIRDEGVVEQIRQNRAQQQALQAAVAAAPPVGKAVKDLVDADSTVRGAA